MSETQYREDWPELARRVCEASRMGDLVVLSGAGSSMGPPANLPGWAGFAEQLASWVEPFQAARATLMREEIAQRRLLSAIDLFESAPSPTRQIKQAKLIEFFESATAPTLAHNTIARLPTKQWITTNYDNLLKRAVLASDQLVESIGNSQEELANALSLWKQKRFVIHIHGRAHNIDSMALGQLSYQALSQNAAYKELLKRIHLHSSILAFGFSYADPLFEAMARWIKNSLHGNTEHTHFILWNKNDDFPHWLADINFQPVLFDPKPDFSEPLRFLELVQRVCPKTAPSKKAPNNQHIEIRKLAAIVLSARDATKHTRYQLACAAISRRVLEDQRGAAEIDALPVLIAAKAHVSIDQARRMLNAASAAFAAVGIVANSGKLRIEEGSKSVTHDGVVVEALCKRFRTFRSGAVTDKQLEAIVRRVAAQVLITQGMTLARSLLDIDSPEGYDLQSLVAEAIAESDPAVPEQIVEPLQQSLVEVLGRPSSAVSSEMYRLAQAAFSLERVFLHPQDPMAGEVLKWRVFLDSNIILRILFNSDHQAKNLSSLLARLRKLGVPLLVLFPFVEEVFEHLQLVAGQLAKSGVRDRKSLVQFIQGLPETERSPALDRFLHEVRSRWVTFHAFLDAHGLSSIKRIEDVLGKFGCGIEGRRAVAQLDNGERETIWSELRHWRNNRAGLDNRGVRVLRRNEATQVLWLDKHRRTGHHAWFLSLDGHLRMALKQVLKGHYAGYVLTPTALAMRFDELHWGEIGNSGFAEMMWALPQPSTHDLLEARILETALEQEPGLSEVNPERLRDEVERFVLNLPALDDPPGFDQGLFVEDVVGQVGKRAVSELLEHLLPKKGRH